MEVLETAECLRLLREVPVGRVVFTDQALPAVMPVAFRLDGDAVLLRTSAGSELDVAARHVVVAFEVDDIDVVYRKGWSVTVVGHAEPVTDPSEIERVSHLPLAVWSSDDGQQFIRIRMEMISGRRIVPPGEAPA